MGLFGRDDKSTKPQSEPVAPAPRPSVSSPSPVSAGTRTTVARGSVFEGTISGAADIVVEGEVKGVVDGSAGLVVAESCRVSATLHGRQRGDRSEKADRPEKPAPKDAQEAPGTGPKNGGKAS